MSRRWIQGLVGVGGVAVLSFVAATWEPAIAPIDPPAASSFSPERVASGERLAIAAGCIDCHTVENGARGAGGAYIFRERASATSTNITPDPETGIGRWSLAAFTRAMREGVARDGSHLLPAFPFDHYTKLTDADIGAIYAYLMTLPPTKAAPVSSPAFPRNIRALQAVWNAIYVDFGAYRADPRQSAQWNRGAYLAEAVAACSGCHTPRNVLGAEQAGHPYGGALLGDRGWWSAPLDIPASPARWTEAQMVEYLRTGESVPHGTALSDMQKVVRSLRGLPDPDLAAIATYIVSSARQGGALRDAAAAKAEAPSPPREEIEIRGQKIYQANCADCHDKTGATPTSARSPIGLAASLWMDEPNNFVRIMLDGIQREEGVPGPTMPGFRARLNDQELAAIAAYLRRSRTTLSPWGEIQVMVGRIRVFTADFLK